ncbi:kinase-like protein [Canariomyces notabilis]|uniref:Kinase-like protein n=1 Tax=Canariomyces notabilis TaxID=2074819 RepID=A0AAN6QJR5_9PEZI|nr:kinase-like protein [Canariomyces arenarius]
MSTVHPILYEPVDDVERLDVYRPGGYHPIQVGDHLHNRYGVVHKLGHGSFSTIWLAKDEQLSKYVAIKVGTAYSDHKEADILAELASPACRKQDQRGNKLITPVFDRFTLDGPNGTHPCLVTSPARCSLADAKEASTFPDGMFQLDVARSMAAQVAMAVAFIHDNGYVHGDLHLGNILLQFPWRLDLLSTSQLYEEFGHPDPQPVVRADGESLSAGVPSHVFPPVWLGKISEHITLAQAKILLTDFGVAFRPAQESRFKSYSPLPIRPPEARFDVTTPLSFSSDIWSLACAIWEILGLRPLFDGWLCTEDDITSDQIEALGPLPPEWWKKWDARSKYYTEDGQPKESCEAWSWNQRLERDIQDPRRRSGLDILEEEEQDALFEMLWRMLAFRPEDRPSANEVLQMAWMRNWAIPDSERTWNNEGDMKQRIGLPKSSNSQAPGQDLN